MADMTDTEEGLSGQNAAGAEGARDGGTVDKTDADGGLHDQNVRLRQELAEQKELNRRAVPYVQAALALQKADPNTYQKLVKGEELTPKQEAAVDKAAKAEGLTLEQIEKAMDAKLGTLVQQMDANRKAEQDMAKLDEWASKELDGYSKVKGTREWNGVLQSVLGNVENGTWEPPKGEDPWQWVVKQTYAIVCSQHPDLKKGSKPAKKTEAERAAEILAGRRTPSASSSTDELTDLPDDIKSEIEWIRSIGSNRGKRFSP